MPQNVLPRLGHGRISALAYSIFKKVFEVYCMLIFGIRSSNHLEYSSEIISRDELFSKSSAWNILLLADFALRTVIANNELCLTTSHNKDRILESDRCVRLSFQYSPICPPSFRKPVVQSRFLWNFIKKYLLRRHVAAQQNLVVISYLRIFASAYSRSFFIYFFLLRNGVEKKIHTSNEQYISTCKVSITDETKHDNSIAGQCPVLTGAKRCDLSSWLTVYTHLVLILKWWKKEERKCRLHCISINFWLPQFFGDTGLSRTKLLLLRSQNNDDVSFGGYKLWKLT